METAGPPLDEAAGLDLATDATDDSIDGFNVSCVTVIERMDSKNEEKADQGSDSGVDSCYGDTPESPAAPKEKASPASAGTSQQSNVDAVSARRPPKDPAKKRTTPGAVPPIPPKPTRIEPGRTRSKDRPPVKPQLPPKTPVRTPEVARSRDTKETPRSSRTSSRSSSTPTATTPTSTGDGRWPSSNSRPSPLIGRITSKMTRSTEPKTPNTIEKTDRMSVSLYGTLPRRKKERSADSLTTDHQPLTIRRPNNSGLLSRSSSLRRTKTKIYHETSAQTALTSGDLEAAFNGCFTQAGSVERVETANVATQVDGKSKEIKAMEERIKSLTEENKKLKEELDDSRSKLENCEKSLVVQNEEKEALKDELTRISDRLMTLVGKTGGDDETSQNDSLMLLESKFHSAGDIILKQEKEISSLQVLCMRLRKDLNDSVQNEALLLQQQHELEAESAELKEFLQAEKQTLSETLREAENDIRCGKEALVQKEAELIKSQEESKHLVRISEQRRQENITLEARMGALESRYRRHLLRQDSAASKAALALNDLSGRLEGLVDQLIESYNISDKDLEDVIFHNEAYRNPSESSTDASPLTPDPPSATTLAIKAAQSPKRGASFISAIIGAIKSAAHNSFANNTPTSTAKTDDLEKSTSDDDDENSDSGEMLDSETEPCLMMENVLEDAPMPDAHSHNMVSSTSSMLSHSRSLQNLSQAIIANRRVMWTEDDISAEDDRSAHPSAGDAAPSSMLDQVIRVDNLLTKLLKVLRLIQTENDIWQHEVQDERDELAERLTACRFDEEAKVAEYRELCDKLGCELKEVKSRVVLQAEELDEAKGELLANRAEIQRLNEDVSSLSKACNHSENQQQSKELEVRSLLDQWERTRRAPSPDSLAALLVELGEKEDLKERLKEKDKQLNEITRECLAVRQVMTENWSSAMVETKRQYEAIDSALETLQSVQSVVQQCPSLAQLQRDLEEANFRTVTSKPPSPIPENAALAAALKATPNA